MYLSELMPKLIDYGDVFYCPLISTRSARLNLPFIFTLCYFQLIVLKFISGIKSTTTPCLNSWNNLLISCIFSCLPLPLPRTLLCRCDANATVVSYKSFVSW